MEKNCNYISYRQTGYFSKMVTDYLNNAPQLKPFYNLLPAIEKIEEAINQRKNFKHRNILVETLQQQYSNITMHEDVAANLKLLLNENTFTVTTAHQPNIFAGPLYVVYKIFHVIQLAADLKKQFPHYNFVPVYFMGSEDADLNELNNITINQRKYIWETKQTGAVGRMKVDRQLLQVLNEIEGQISVLPHGNELMQIFREAYTEKSTIQQASLKMLDAIFGEYGLVILIPDNINFKKIFQPVFEKEIKEQFSYKAVTATAKQLEAHYKVQASGRELNLFYLIDDKRERIETNAAKFKVENLKLDWTKEELLKELSEQPQRFSPNVILRGILQETILPNLVFIGGGGELAYWLELKEVFNAAEIPYPLLLLRNSFLLIDKKTAGKLNRMEFSFADIFKDEQELLKDFTLKHSSITNLSSELTDAENLYNHITSSALKTDATLAEHTTALKTKTLKGLAELEKKMLRAEKKKFVAEQEQIKKIKSIFFPDKNLQERIENFSGFYARNGKSFLNDVLACSKSFQQEFGIISE